MRQAFKNWKSGREVMKESPVSAEGTEKSPPPPKEAPQFVERKLIKNGSISFETNDIEKTRKEIEKLYRQFNGYVASENHFNYGERLKHEQEIRIPSQNFDPFIQKLEHWVLESKIKISAHRMLPKSLSTSRHG